MACPTKTNKLRKSRQVVNMPLTALFVVAASFASGRIPEASAFSPRPIIVMRPFTSNTVMPARNLNHSVSRKNRPRNEVMAPRKASSDDETISSDEDTKNRLDAVLSKLTSAFPLFVASAALWGYRQPAALSWINHGSLISWLLAAIMCGTGLTLRPADFVRVRRQWTVVPLGVASQFTVMPATAWCVSRWLLLGSSAIPPSTAQALALGLVLVGCSPGGTASNLVTLIAGADVALSVVLTSCSTLLAVLATPVLVQLLAGGTSTAVSGWALCAATAKVVLGPVVTGMVVNQKFPGVARQASRFTPLASVLLVSAICGGVVAQNAGLLQASAGSLGRTVVTAVLALHTIGFALGYAVPRYAARKSKRTARTVSIEVGMQNSALAVVLARAMGAPDLAALPGALSATAHSCLGSLLAAVWRIQGKDEDDHEADDDTKDDTGETD